MVSNFQKINTKDKSYKHISYLQAVSLGWYPPILMKLSILIPDYKQIYSSQANMN